MTALMYYAIDGQKSGIVGSSPQMMEVYRSIDLLAGEDMPVLIRGPTGSGKELVARALHYNGAREGKFEPINLAAVPRDLISSILFGHVKGAFTGAWTDKQGLFETAADGTLFLDEVSEVEMEHQAVLLRAIQEQRARRVGSDNEYAVSARIISASNADLASAMSSGIFREDLFYRLSPEIITVPALDERKEDIPALIQYFLVEHNNRYGTRITGVSSEVQQTLQDRDWPGNVRELQNEVGRLFRRAREGDVTSAQLEEVGDVGLSARMQPLPSIESSLT